MCDSLIVNFRKYGSETDTNSVWSTCSDDDSNAVLEKVGDYPNVDTSYENEPESLGQNISHKSSVIDKVAKPDLMKDFKTLESRMDTMQAELMQMMQRFFNHVLENQNKIKTNISNLSQRVHKIEDMILNQPSVYTRSRRGSMDTLGSNKANQQVNKKKKKKREALMTSIFSLSHVVKNISKSEKIKNLLYQQIQSNVVFQTCSEEELFKINKAFDSKSYTAGSLISKQGSLADRFFVIEEGVLDVLQDGVHVEVLKAPGSFGEIALLFGSSYHVTIYARSDCKLWCLHQYDYRAVTSQYKLKRMQFKIDFLRKVKIADKVLGEVLEPSDIDDMALTTRNETFRNGDVIVREGEIGNVFYMIEEGCVAVYKKEFGDKPLVTLSSGNFFGEKALLHDGDVRQATCVATSANVKCIFLMREDFVRMLGDLQDLLDKSWKTQPYTDVYAKTKVDKPVKNKINVKLKNLEVIRVLGTGAFSTVKLVKLKSNRPAIKTADNEKDVKLFALKCLNRNLDPNIKLDQLISNEKDIMSELESPFIIHFYCEIRDSDNIFFLLEALLGGDLFNVLHDMSKFPEDWCKFYAANVICAFTEIHNKRIAYRDLKPENLIMDNEGYIKIIDFGLSKKIQGGKSWTLCGTLDYLSPEMILNEGHDWAVDYWAMGVFIYEIASGISPFAVDDQFEMYRKILSCKIDIPADFSRKLGDLVIALLRKCPSKRLGKTKGGTKKIMEHMWFAGFDWDSLFSKKLKSPFLPQQAHLDYDFDSDEVCDHSIGIKDSISSLEHLTNAEDKNIEGIYGHVNHTLKRKEDLNEAVQSTNIISKAKNIEQPFSSFDIKNEQSKDAKYFDAINGCPSESTREDISSYGLEENSANKSNLSLTLEKVSNNDKTVNRKVNRHTVTLDSLPEVYESTKTIDTEDISSVVCTSILTEDSTLNRDDYVCHDEIKKVRERITSKIFVNTKRLSILEQKSFNRFSLFSVTSKTLTLNILSAGNGSNFLDPFVAKTSDQIDSFPYQSTNIDEISSFCLPNGAGIRFIPKCTLNNAHKIGWAGEKADRYQLHVFTDVSGTRSYGISITVKEILEIPNSSNFILLKKKRKAVAIISNWWQSIFFNKRKDVNLSLSPGGIRRFYSVGPITDLTAVRKKSFVAFSSMMSKVGQQINNEVAPRIENQLTRKSLYSAFPKQRFESIHPKNINMGKELNKKGQKISMSAKSKAIISYGNMMLNERQGLIAIVDKCYLLVGIKLEEQSLLFNALQSLVDSEREITFSIFDRKKHYATVRHSALSEIQNLRLSSEQSLINNPKNESDCIQEKEQHYMYDFLSSGLVANIRLPLPLPQPSTEWGVSTLVLRIKMSSLLILLKLLLIERSVLIIGESYEDVTACTCALLELLKPFKWPSVFVPILPEGMLDFVSSPVPFIAGAVANTKEKLKLIENDTRVENAMLSGLSVLNISCLNIAFTVEDGIRNIVSRCFSTVHLWDENNKLNCLQGRLRGLVNDNNKSSLLSFKSFFQYGASYKERRTLCSIRTEICAHLSSLPSALVSNSIPNNGWKQFGIYNDDSKEFDFHPSWYIEAVRYQLQFEEMLAHTQLFIGFLDEERSNSQIEHNPIKLKGAITISKWLSPMWRKRRHKIIATGA